MPRAQVLAYQRALLDAVNLLSLRRQDLELAKAELAAAIDATLRQWEKNVLTDPNFDLKEAGKSG